MVRIELGCSNSTLTGFSGTRDKKSDSTEQYQNLVDTSRLRHALCDLRFELLTPSYWLQAGQRSLWCFEAWTGAKFHCLGRDYDWGTKGGEWLASGFCGEFKSQIVSCLYFVQENTYEGIGLGTRWITFDVPWLYVVNEHNTIPIQ